MDNLSISNLVTLMSTEIPIDTTTSSMEAGVVKKSILTRIYDMSNLTGV